MRIKYFLAVVVLATAILSFGSPAKTSAAGCMLQFSSLSTADQISCLKEAISDLMTQLSQLQSQQGTTTWCHTFNKNLKYDDTCQGSGDNCEVLQLQNALNKEGIQGVYGDNANGSGGIAIFGDNTASGVVQFQKKYGIMQTGFVGIKTRTKLNSLYGCTTPPIQNTQPSINITAPNGGETWNVGETHNITWTSNGVNQVYVYWVGYDAAGNFLQQVPLSTDGSGNPVAISASTDNFSWTITGKLITLTAGTKSKILITDADAGNTSISDYSNGYFSIVLSNPSQPSINITAPNGGETWNVGETHNITWTSNGVNQVYVGLVQYDSNGNVVYQGPLSTDGNNNQVSVPASPNNFSWTITGKLINLSSGTTSRIKITDVNSNTATYSNYFTIVNPNGNLPVASLTITSPQNILSSLAGNTWQVGGTYNITWTSTNMPSGDTIDIYLLNGGSNAQKIASSVPISNGTYSWTIPTSITNYSSYYTIHLNPAQIPNQGMTGIQDSKDFTITSPANQPSITITSPNGGEQWTQGQTYNITWTTSGYDPTANVEIDFTYTTPTGYANSKIANTTNTGSYSWQIPYNNFSGNSFKIQIFIKKNGSQNWETNSMSNNYFKIINPNQGVG